MGFFKDDLKRVRAFIFDVDGVISHQTQNLSEEGELIRTSCTKDGYAMMYAIRKGYRDSRRGGTRKDRTRFRPLPRE